MINLDSAHRPQRGVKRQIPRKLGGIVLLFDAAALFAAFATTKYISSLLVSLSDVFAWEREFHHFDTRRYYYFFLCFFILVRFVLKGHYSRRVPWMAQVETIIQTIVFAALFDAFNYYFLDYGSLPLMLLCNWTLCIVLLVLGRQVSTFIISKSRAWKLPIALVGGSRMVQDTFYAFYNDGHTGYEIQKVLLTGKDNQDFTLDFIPKSHPDVQLLRDDGHIDDFIKNNRQYYYVFDMEELRGPNKEKLTNAIDIAQIEYGLIPNTKSLDVYGMEPHYFFGNDIMILHRRDSIRSPSGRFFKRMIDIVVSGLALPFLGLLTLVVYVMKKIEKSDVPIFYGGEREGMNGQLFNCWKFCTMRTDGDTILANLLERDENARAEWDKFQKLKNDPRIDSKISGLLRKVSLDELPQIWNVFKGDMSLVGPRPIIPYQRVDYGDLIEHIMPCGQVSRASGRSAAATKRRSSNASIGIAGISAIGRCGMTS